MKSLIFYGSNGDAAKSLAAEIRKEKGAGAQLRHAVNYRGESENVDRVLLLPCVSDFDAKRIGAVFGERVTKVKGPGLPPPPIDLPPPPADPLVDLPADWRSKEPAELRRLAEVVGGRAVENKKQAVEVIETELAKRAAK